MGLLRVIIAALTFSVAASFAAADPALEDIAARTKLNPIQTLTLSNSQFLTGDVNAQATTIAGLLANSARLRPVAAGRVSAWLGRYGCQRRNVRREILTLWVFRHLRSTASPAADSHK